MIRVYKLTKRHMDENEKMPKELKDIKIFSTCVGHGVGTIDFSELVLKIEDAEYEKIINESGEYVKFKLGNISRYFEVEIFIEHALKLIPQLCDCELKNILKELREGYLILKKDF